MVQFCNVSAGTILSCYYDDSAVGNMQDLSAREAVNTPFFLEMWSRVINIPTGAVEPHHPK
jgi:hypothetical protein